MKSLYTQLAESVDKMTPKQRDKWYESRKANTPIEVQLNCAEAILSGKVKESAPNVKKNNGAGDNGRGEELRESSPITEVDNRESRLCKIEKRNAAETRALLKRPQKTAKQLGLTESEYQKFSNLIRVGRTEIEALLLCSNRVSREFDAARRRGVSAQAFIESLTA
jgi:hypothetical protein